MTPKNSILRQFATVLAFALAGTIAVHAQQQQRSGSSSGGSSSGSRPGGSSGYSGGSGSSGNSTRDYPNNTLPGDATVSIDPETHSLIIMTDDETFKAMSNVVSKLDRPKPQVLIKVVFLEVQTDDALDFGVEGTFNQNPFPSTLLSSSASSSFGLSQLGNVGQQIGQTTMPTGQGLYSVVGSDFQATVRAIASSSKVEVLSRPSILVRNNQPATITVGQSVPLVTGVTVNALTGSPLSTIAYQNVGIILQVTPFISSDGLVEMIVAPQISSLSSQSVAVSSNVYAPVIDLRSASTVVVTPDGQTVVIGGLMEKDKTVIDSKIPILGDIPYLGALFKHKQSATTKKELLIFLTPHIVIQPAQIASATATESRNADLSHKAFTDKELDKFFDRLPVKPNTATATSGTATQ